MAYALALISWAMPSLTLRKCGLGQLLFRVLRDSAVPHLSLSLHTPRFGGLVRQTFLLGYPDLGIGQMFSGSR